MPLQADPTVIFAMKRNRMILSHQSFLVYRIHTNTYMNIGLPPGPIAARYYGVRSGSRSWKMILFISASVERFGYHELYCYMPEHNVNKKNIQIGSIVKA
jgi:hypothetical protein